MPSTTTSLPSSFSLIAVVFTFLATTTAIKATETSSCSHSPPGGATDSSPSPCPPFSPSSSSSLPYPFSFNRGCGHPSFHITCSTPDSFISINNLTFSILHFDSNSSSLRLSPVPTPRTTRSICSASTQFPFIPSHPINLSSTPFRFSASSCSRLSLVKPCDTDHLPNCAHCPWLCPLIHHPTRLFHDCPSSNSDRNEPVPEQGCQRDVLGFLDEFLEMGIQIDWDQQPTNSDPYFSDCNDCRSNHNGVCGYDSSDPDKRFLCLDPSPEPLATNNTTPWIRTHRKAAVLSSVFLLLLVLCLLLSALLLLLRHRRLLAATRSLNPEDPTTLFLHRHRSASLLPPVFTYEDLETSTARFDPSRKIGDGGFGSVFLGHLPDARVVAVKYLHRPPTSSSGLATEDHRGLSAAFSTKSFCNEILILSSIDHPSLVKLHGYCSDPRGLLLVYDYVPNGTLADHLHGPMSLHRSGALSWPVRVEIALQIAMALEYLHFSVQPPVVHRDVTTSNIFVDRDLRVKLGDFGLSRLLVCPQPGDHHHNNYPTTASSPNALMASSSPSGSSGTGFVWTGPQGTPGYLDPDYHRSFQLTEKSDVYSYGVVLMELVTGKKAVDRRREKREVALVDVVVPRIQTGLLGEVVDPVLAAVDATTGKVVAEGVEAVAELAFRCVAADKDDRPDAKEVAAEMRRIWGRTRGVKPGGVNSNVAVVVPQSS